jgi:O-antigen/teichoic acid export membrane protein
MQISLLNNLKSKNGFVKNVGTLFTGTSLAQILPLAISPFLTRVYSPEEFGLLAMFVAISSVIGVISTGRYELAIIQAETDRIAVYIFGLSVSIAMALGIICLCLILFVQAFFLKGLFITTLGLWVYFVPLSVFSVGLFQSLNYWFSRKKLYKDLAFHKVIQSLVNATFCVTLFAFKSVPALGLILGYVFAQVLTAILLFKKSGLLTLLVNVNINQMLESAKRFKKFPTYSAPGALFNTAAIQAPVLYISNVFELLAVGYFNFVYKIIGGPLALLSTAISQVFLQRITSGSSVFLYRNVATCALALSSISLPVVFIISFYGREIFSLVFGDNWSHAGEYAEILVFSIAIRFIVSPLSMVVAMERYLKWGFYWQCFTLLFVLMFLYLSKNLSFEKFVYLYVIQDVFSYLVYFVIILSAARRESLRVRVH